MAKFQMPKSGQLFLVLVMAIVFLQVIGYLLGGALGFEFNAGPLLVLLFIGLAAWVAIGIVEGYWVTGVVDRQGLVLFLIVAGLVAAISILLPNYLPEIFGSGARTIQAAIIP